MKKSILQVILTVLFAAMACSCFAQTATEDPALENAITSLWINGPDAKIEKQLNSGILSSDEKTAAKSIFHLSCLKLMQGDKEKSIELLNRLRMLESSDETKAFIKRLENMLLNSHTKESALTENRINLKLKDVEIGNVLSLIAKTADINLVKHNSVKGKISIQLKDATVKDSLDVICKMSDLDYEKNGNIYLVFPRGMHGFNKNYAKEEVTLAYLSPDNGKKILSSNKQSFPDLIARTYKDNLLLEGSPESIEKAKQLLFARDKEGKAHTISIKIWELKKNNQSVENFSKLDEKAKQELAKLLSAPKLVALPGQKAKIKVGHNSENKEKVSEDIFSYETDLVFNEAGESDHVILEMNNKIFGLTFDKEEKKEIKRSFSTTVKIKKNMWLSFPIDESKKIFMELNVKAN